MKHIFPGFFILFLTTSAITAPEDAVFVVIRIMYNTLGESPVLGRIGGTAFLIDKTTVLTAYHVLNEGTTKPTPGFKYLQQWLLKRGDDKMIIPLENVLIRCLPGIETTIIKLKNPVVETSKIEVEMANTGIDDEVYSIGHRGAMPILNIGWVNGILVIRDYLLQDSIKADKTGSVMKITRATVHSPDINIDDIVVIEPSFQGILGM